jgi:hypothetical protein
LTHARPPSRVESPRDLGESAFTPILRRMFDAIPSVLAAVFVDMEGECIDYVSALEPYEAKVAAAHLHMLMSVTRASRATEIVGEALALEIASSSERVMCAWNLGDEYALMALIHGEIDRSRLRDALARVQREFRAEVGLDSPDQAAASGQLSVSVRPSAGWTYAPSVFLLRGSRVKVNDVIGRWSEYALPQGRVLVCFRVRTQAGREVTLVHDQVADLWLMRD